MSATSEPATTVQPKPHGFTPTLTWRGGFWLALVLSTGTSQAGAQAAGGSQ